MKIPYSYSRLLDYSKCPFYFHKKYVDKLPLPDSSILTSGEIIHDIMKNYTLECYRQHQTHLYESWEQIALSVLREYKVLPEDEDTILEVVKRYIEGNEVELEGLAGVEEELAVDELFMAVQWSSPNVWFRAKLDKFYLAGENAKITDYKSGYSMDADKFQIELYAWLIFNIYKQVQFIEGELDFIRHDFKKNWVIPRVDLPKIDRRIRSRIAQIEKDEKFEPKINSMCGDCPFWNLCPAIKLIGYEHIVKTPKTKKEATELLNVIIAREKEADELKKVLKMFVEKSGDVKTNDMVARIIGSVSYKWDVRQLLIWAENKGLDIQDALTADTRKLKAVQGIPQDYCTKKVSTSFRIVKNKEEKEKE